MRIINKRDNKALIYYKNNFYVVSEACNEFTDHDKETLIFKSSPTGVVDDYNEVGGGRGLTLDEVLNNINKYLYQQEG